MASRINQKAASPWLLVLTALGIVYGDIGTSPLYALREVFHGPHAIALNQDNIFGVLSMITWSLIFIISLKYLRYVLRADNKGEGGVLALTALATLQKDKKIFAQKTFLYLGLFGASLMVGDCMITPAISVLSAVEGLQVAAPDLSNFVLPITFFILIVLFYFQHKGTAKIGVFFGPIMLVWFSVLGILGLLSVIVNPVILEAANPMHAINFWVNEPGFAMLAMGGIFLVITGGEALYADLGHFGQAAIAKGWFYIALPGLVINYFGQGALLLRDPATVSNPFFFLAPSWMQMPLVILATCATIIASQAVISGFFSLAHQCVQLGYAPRLNIIHTSDEEAGQIYVPMVNWLALIGTLWLVIEFKTSSSLAAAYGISISITMVITTILTSIVAWHTWHWRWHKVAAVFLFFIAFEIVFMVSNLLKVFDGGWVPVLIAGVTFALMTTWKKGRTVLYDRLRKKSYPFQNLLSDLKKLNLAKVEGTAVFMVGDADMTPPTLLHNISHNKVLHETIIFLTVIGEEVAYVPEQERVQVRKIADGFFRVTAHYGFSQNADIIHILNTAKALMPEIKIADPTFFLGREILVAGVGEEMIFWRKILFSVMARNAASANSYFKLPLDRVIEVGMQIEL